MTIDLDELERLAKAAAPGPWEQNEGCVHDALGDCVTLDTSSGAYIAAANPETVLALVKRVRELEQGLKVIREECHAAVNEAEFREGGSKGMQVPYHGPFASGLRLPSVVRDLRQQRAFVDRVLAGESHD